ncbi:MAG: cobyrinate a,c-diamide synthase [Acidobacteriota bacterium]
MSAPHYPSRLVIAGLAGDSGKSIVSLAILRRLSSSGSSVHAFKKGPDYIDSAWLSWASQHPARNLDTWMMGFDRAALSFQRHAATDGLNLIEGNRGLFDGSDASGTHSTAELAKALQAPVLLVVNVAKMTRTAGALVLGCRHLDPALNLAGVILNRVHGSRHESVVRASIEAATGIPVVGAVPSIGADILPDRHLGLVTPSDYTGIDCLPEVLEKVAEKLDMDQILSIAAQAPPLSSPSTADPGLPSCPGSSKAQPAPRIVVLRDAAFNFYYPENLEALASGGAELVFHSSMEDGPLPEDVDAIYIGGGFPEVHAARISSNAGFLNSLAAAATRNVPIYAECGGLMLLARSIEWGGKQYPMAGVLPVDVALEDTHQGHGYVEMIVTESNPFFPRDTVLRGHEFHYSSIATRTGRPSTACAVRRGTGAFDKRDGLILGSVWASYTHIHASANPQWAEGMLLAARLHASGQAPSTQRSSQ